jgi:hypothetical protein
MDAGTAVEHLAKACLVSRHPALLVELRNSRANWNSLVVLLSLPEGKFEQLRTIGLRVCLERLQFFMKLPAPADVELLVDLRDGVVHLGSAPEVDDRILRVFLKLTDLMLSDMGAERVTFWGDLIHVVDTLLVESEDRVANRVKAKIQLAIAEYDRRYRDLPAETRNHIRRVNLGNDWGDETTECPACGCDGLVSGRYSIEDTYDIDGPEEGGEWVQFHASEFFCLICRLRLTEPSEMKVAGMKVSWIANGISTSEVAESLGVDVIPW